MKTYALTILITEGDENYEMSIEIPSMDLDDLSDKFKALQILSKTLNHDDFMMTVDLIGEKPGLIPVIKDLIREGEELTESQLLVRLPKYVKQVLTVLKS